MFGHYLPHDEVEVHVDLPGLGQLTRDDELGWYTSQPVTLPILGGRACPVVLDGYDDDPDPEAFHRAVADLLNAPPAVLLEAEPYLVQYCSDANDVWEPGDPERVELDSPGDVWTHLHILDATVSRRGWADGAVYISFQGDVDWELEHGLQIVFRGATKLVKVGPYDGHLTNADAYGDPGMENVIYPTR
jgi:hypothetical protein